MMLCSSCVNIPDQDAEIRINGADTANVRFVKACNRVYDTTAVSLRCFVKYNDGSSAKGQPVKIFHGGQQLKSQTTIDGIADLGWLTAGKYAMSVGEPGEYPYITINNIDLAEGRGYEITIRLPVNR